MRLQLVTGPLVEPVSLLEARDHLRVDTADEDALILALIVTARTHVENLTGRALITQTWRLNVDEWPESGSRIRIPKSPVRAISSVQYVGQGGALSTLATSGYQLVLADVAPAVALPYGSTWPAIEGDDAVRITFTAGYGDYPSAVPAPLRHAVLMMTAHLYANREVASAEDMRSVPMAFDALLSTYRTVLL